MKEEALINNNQIKIQGVVVGELKFSHEVYGENFFNFDVEIPRLSDSKDILPVTISERLIEKERLQIGTVVLVEGQIRSYNSYNNIEKRNRLILTIFAREIEIAEEELSNLNPNEVFLNGFLCKKPIYRTTPFGREISDILIAVNRAYNKSDYIPCIAWGRNARFTSNLAIGDNIRLLGRMQSRAYQKKLETADVLEKVAYEVSISKIDVSKKESSDEYDSENNYSENSYSENVSDVSPDIQEEYI